MTSRSRRKRQTTAPNSARASKPAAPRGPLAWSLGLGVAAALVLGLPLSAGESPRTTASAAKLKWHAKGVPAQALTDSEAASEPAPKCDAEQCAATVVAEAPAGIPARLPTQPASKKRTARSALVKPRAKLRDSIMQVSGQAKEPEDPFPDLEDALKDPPKRDQLDLDTDPKLPADTEGTPNLEPAVPSDTPSETSPSEPPMTLEQPSDPFPQDPVPSPPTNEPSGDLSEGISTSGGGVGCHDYKSECSQAITHLQARDMTKIVVGLIIEGTEGTDFPCECKLGREVNPTFAGRHFSPTMFTWKATGVCHKPLYFEDVNLERYGHSWNPVVQPFMSAAHFFVSVPLLPYKMGLTTPNECMYTLGYYRPGSCAPWLIDPIPLSFRAAMFQAGAVTGFAYWFWPPG